MRRLIRSPRRKPDTIARLRGVRQAFGGAFMKLKVTMAAGALRTPSWLHMALAVFCLCLPVPAGAAGADAPEWQKFCEAVPDTNCVTWIQVSAQNGSSAVISIVEPTRNSPQKMLRIVAHFEGAPPPQNGAAQVIVDAKPFADVPFARCAGADCLGEKQISAADVATLESAKSFVVQAATVQVSSPIGNLAAARAGRGKTFAEVKAEGERLIQELQKRAD
jgi:invasion protein IalB